MTLPVRKSLHDAVLQASKADTWEQATKEWNEVSLIFNGIGRSNCVCGNAIKYAYELFNGVTGQRLFPIGSDCVFVIFIDCPLTSNWKRKKNCSERLKI